MYVIPLIIIVLIITVKLSKSKLTEWQGRVLKLFSGLMIFLLGLVLVFIPELLSNVFSTISLLLTALLSASVIAFITKKYQEKTDVS